MDDDDNQDELINHNASHSKGKRAALWAISDDSDDVEGESDDGESDSGEEEEEEHLDGQDEEEEEEEEDDEEEDEDTKAEDGAFGGTCADLAGMSSDDDSDKCPICLNSFHSQPVATPESCDHYFCLDCILEWTKNANSCPVDRLTFNNIYLKTCYGGKVKKIITVQKPVKEGIEETVDLNLEQTNCEVCGSSDREDRLLLCDGCDAGYHMECLTPPLDSVPVEEWFCPECEASNRHTRDSAVEVSDTESLPSTAQPATSHRPHHRHQPRATGPTRAIARTQQSERVRANVNRHRITQARTSQLAPTYLIQSTWLDETINAVVAGLNTAVYIRDLTPRARSTHRRKTGKRRKVSSKRTSAKGKGATTGFRRRKRRVRRSRKKLTGKKTTTPRDRIANNLGIVKNKKGSSVPTVYRPSEHTLSNMRADIGAASLSIYGDPFDLDPFSDREEQQQQAQVTSLLEAKRRGISRSALRSHQPVARPIAASLSRRGVDVPQSGGVMEAAPVPDLLGSILTGQSMLLMDSSDVIIRRDGSLKATKPTMPSTAKSGSSNSSISGDAGINPGMSPIQGDSSPSPHYNGHLPASSHSSINRPLSQSSGRSPPCTPCSPIHTQPPPFSDLPTKGHPGLQPSRPNRHNPSHVHRGANDIRASRETSSSSSSSSIHTAPGSKFKGEGTIPSQAQPKKAPAKPMWVDVSVLPRIPKKKRESSVETDDGSIQAGSSGSNRISSTKGSSSSNGYGMPETAMNSLAGDKSRQQSVDHQRGRVDGQAQRHRSDRAGSSSAFSASFSSSSSSTGSPASQTRNPSSSSSSSAVSFRINSSGNSWQSRQLSITSPSTSRGSAKGHWREKEDEAKRRQLRRDKQTLLASHTLVHNEQDSANIYDPFNPTLSDSSSSDSEAESSRLDKSCLRATHEFKAPSLRRKGDEAQNKQDLVHVKTETEETEVSQEEPRRANALESVSQEAGCSQQHIKVEKESRYVDVKVEKQTSFLDIKVKKEPGLDEGEAECDVAMDLNSETADTTVPAHLRLQFFKSEKKPVKEENVESEASQHIAFPNCKKDSSASSSAPTKKKQAESKSDYTSCSKSPSTDMGHSRKTSKAPKESSGSETDRSRRGDRHASGQGGRQKEKEKDRERRSRSRERRRARSTSQSSQSNSSDRSIRKRRQSRSLSKDRKRSRSVSSSSSRERSRRKKHEQMSKERNDDREGDHKRGHMSKDKRPGRSRSRSRSRSPSRPKDDKRGLSRSKSRSRSRSRSRERRKDHTRQQQPSQSSRDRVGSRSKDKRRHRSRSSSKERLKEERPSSKSLQENLGSPVSSSKDKKQIQDMKKEKDVVQNPLKREKQPKDSKQEFPPSTSTSKVKKEVKDLREIQNEAPTAEITKEVKVVKEIKKEKQPSLDMFEDSPVTKSIKTEEMDNWSLLETKDIKKERIEGDFSQTQMCGIKTETCEIRIKSEPSSPKVCHLTSSSTLTAAATADTHQDAASPWLMTSEEQPCAAGLALSVKQEAPPPSDSDEDFNVDVMLDSLDYVKSECTEGGDGFVKQEKEDEEGKKEGEQVSAVAGAKSKAPVKRVTWNIQEPEGPQPEKSASKLALYKLKLKQEGARRPSSAAQASSQVNMGESSKKGAGALSVTGQGDEEKGDVSRKDKYLKKLHMQERAVEEVKLAIKPFYQKRDIDKDEYKDILRKAVQKVCHSKSGEINPVKVGNLVKAYVDKYKHARKHNKGEEGAANL